MLLLLTSEHTCVLHACSPIYEHVSRHPRMLLYIRARKSPSAHAPLHTST
ncbi:hypothetical protein HanRHA438_Chr10g0472501 [Helianthus annuus]|nr:hypothetical protein HanRHA438_Chr10g0472501 [Helianthus annuus]